MAKTSSIISTISYNTVDFLKSKLDAFIYDEIIQYYEFIKHQADEDDKKSHIHLIIFPNKSLDLVSFQKRFTEPVPNDNPLKCMPFRKSIFGDWYWYVLHDERYLKCKQLYRNISYTDKDIISSDRDFHLVLLGENPIEKFNKMSDVYISEFVKSCVIDNVPLCDVIKSGFIPLNKVSSVIQLYRACFDTSDSFIFDKTYANKHIQKNKNIERSLNLKGIETVYTEKLPFKDDLYE